MCCTVFVFILYKKPTQAVPIFSIIREKGYIEGVKDDNQFREQFKLLSSKLRQGERDRNFGGTTGDKLKWGSDDMYSEALFKKRDELRRTTDDFIKRDKQK